MLYQKAYKLRTIYYILYAIHYIIYYVLYCIQHHMLYCIPILVPTAQSRRATWKGTFHFLCHTIYYTDYHTRYYPTCYTIYCSVYCTRYTLRYCILYYVTCKHSQGRPADAGHWQDGTFGNVSSETVLPGCQAACRLYIHGTKTSTNAEQGQNPKSSQPTLSAQTHSLKLQENDPAYGFGAEPTALNRKASWPDEDIARWLKFPNFEARYMHACTHTDIRGVHTCTCILYIHIYIYIYILIYLCIY